MPSPTSFVAVVGAICVLAMLCGCATSKSGDPDTPSSQTTEPVPSTEIRSISPVKADGTLADGYTSRDIPALAALKCFTAVTGTYRCSETPEGLQFCWQAGDATAACLADPRGTEVGMVAATFGVSTDMSPYIPAALDLTDGSHCTLGRNPMAVATGDIRYVHVYGCTGGPTEGVYTEPLPGLGNPLREVIDRTGNRWTVQGGDDTGPTGPLEVAVAYELFGR
ncbi:hypothetical protein [Williamsia sp.]|uniref:hypothetical protein n=1 Tax=Williamsia sp. TaxID=1872085 RepID=UPI002F93F8AC